MTWNDHPQPASSPLPFLFHSLFLWVFPTPSPPWGLEGTGQPVCPQAVFLLAEGGPAHWSPGSEGRGCLEGHASGRASPGRRRLDLLYYWTPGSRLFRPTHEEA